jgi:septum formation protein
MMILASRSPRRRELMRLITEDFTVIESGFDESQVKTKDPKQLVCELAKGKALAVAKTHPDDLVIGCDTVVVSPSGEIFGIPKDEKDAVRMLHALSGQTHRVITGVAVIQKQKVVLFHQTTEVTFRRMSKEDIDWYLKTGEPFDKAGGYGIQGYAGVFVRKINGDYNNVVGLPVAALWKILKKMK